MTISQAKQYVTLESIRLYFQYICLLNDEVNFFSPFGLKSKTEVEVGLTGLKEILNIDILKIEPTI